MESHRRAAKTGTKGRRETRGFGYTPKGVEFCFEKKDQRAQRIQTELAATRGGKLGNRDEAGDGGGGAANWGNKRKAYAGVGLCGTTMINLMDRRKNKQGFLPRGGQRLLCTLGKAQIRNITFQGYFRGLARPRLNQQAAFRKDRGVQGGRSPQEGPTKG